MDRANRAAERNHSFDKINLQMVRCSGKAWIHSHDKIFYYHRSGTMDSTIAYRFKQDLFASDLQIHNGVLSGLA